MNGEKSIDITNYTPEVLSDDVLISAFNVSDDMLVYSQWNDNKIFIYSFKTKKTEVMCEYDMSVSCSSIVFLKCDGITPEKLFNKLIEDIIDSCIKFDLTKIFHQPVKKKEYSDYYDIINNPIFDEK